MRDVN